MQINVSVKPGQYRNMVSSILKKAGFTIGGSGYMIPTDTGDFDCTPPSIDPQDFSPAPVQGESPERSE